MHVLRYNVTRSELYDIRCHVNEQLTTVCIIRCRYYCNPTVYDRTSWLSHKCSPDAAVPLVKYYFNTKRVHTHTTETRIARRTRQNAIKPNLLAIISSFRFNCAWIKYSCFAEDTTLHCVHDLNIVSSLKCFDPRQLRGKR